MIVPTMPQPDWKGGLTLLYYLNRLMKAVHEEALDNTGSSNLQQGCHPIGDAVLSLLRGEGMVLPNKAIGLWTENVVWRCSRCNLTMNTGDEPDVDVCPNGCEQGKKVTLTSTRMNQ